MLKNKCARFSKTYQSDIDTKTMTMQIDLIWPRHSSLDLALQPSSQSGLNGGQMLPSLKRCFY